MRTETVTTEAIDTKKLFRVLSAYERGDFSLRMPADQVGMTGKVYDALNHAIDLNQRMAKELERISAVVGKAGNVRQRAALPSASGEWLACIESVNTLVVRSGAADHRSGARHRRRRQGRPLAGMALEIDDRPLTGEFLRTAKVVNTMVDQLGTFASEVTRVAREVGTEGKLGGQAVVKGVAGTWKDLTDNVNFMAANLTVQVRNIAEVTTAVANGDLSQEDHRRRQGRDPRAEEHHQHDGRSAQLVRLGGHARGARGRHRRQARRPGGGEGRGRHLEGPDRQRQPAGRQPDRAGAQHRRGHDRRRQRRPVQEDHRRRARRDPRAQGHHQHDGRPARARSPRR